MPHGAIVSPWLRQASLRQLGFFVGVWGLTLAYPFLAYAGISELHGVCAWNRIGMGYYLTGYIGYLLLACFIIRADRLSARGAALFRRLASRSFAIFLVHWLFAGLGLPAWLGMPALTAAIFLCSWAVAEALALLPCPAARLLGID